MSYWNQLDEKLRTKANKTGTVQLELYVHDGDRMFCVPAEVVKEAAKMNREMANQYITEMLKIAMKEVVK